MNGTINFRYIVYKIYNMYMHPTKAGSHYF